MQQTGGAPLTTSIVRTRPAEAGARRPVVVIPAFKPLSLLPDLVAQIACSKDIQAVVVVNDGSGPEYDEIFANAAAIDRVTVLRHFVNLGKGAALRTGFNYVGWSFPQATGIITADADGQHAVDDVMRVGGALAEHPDDLIMGVRRFDGEVPLRSRLGNGITKVAMRFLAGQRVSDTQTGLRAVPMDFVPTLMRFRSNGYEFELDMLLACKRTMRQITEVPIRTIYLERNRSSHFSPLLDSMRIYFLLLRFTAVSLTTFVIDNAIFLAAFQFWPRVLPCQAAGRIIAGAYQYFMNKSEVFHSSVQNRSAFPKFFSSVVVFGAMSYLLINVILGFARHFPVAGAKFIADGVLFLFSFVVQRDFVFVGSRRKESSPGRSLQTAETADNP